MPEYYYMPEEYVPSPIAPEGVPTVEDTATIEDLSPETKALIERVNQRIKDRNQREYEEFRKTDVRFTGQKPYVVFPHPYVHYKKQGGQLPKFQPGGIIDSNEQTLDQYLQQKADSTRKAAYETSNNTKDVRVPIIELTQDEKLKLEQEFKSNEKQLQEYLSSKNRPMWMPAAPIDPLIKNRDDSWYNATLERNQKIQEMLNSGCKKGSSCTYHSTGHYGPKYQMASSDEFVVTNGGGAFKEVPKQESLPGDIVISFRDKDGAWDPHHTLMFSKWDDRGNPRYNASNGGSTSDALRFNQLYNVTDSTRTYRFVGSPEDIEQWTQEYNSKYKQGGSLPTYLKVFNYGKR